MTYGIKPPPTFFSEHQERTCSYLKEGKKKALQYGSERTPKMFRWKI